MDQGIDEDPQLAAALELLQARLDGEDWPQWRGSLGAQVRGSEIVAQRAYRDRLLEELASVDEKLAELESGNDADDSEEPNAVIGRETDGPVVLGIESSCDETAAAVVRGVEVLSAAVATQHELHREFGGAVPEIASRAHVERVLPVVRARWPRRSRSTTSRRSRSGTDPD